MKTTILILLLASSSYAQNLKGWGLIVEALVADGFNKEEVVKVFSDRRMPARENITFNLDPKESKASYRKHDTAANRANALRFYKEYQDHFEQAAKLYEIDESIILAILQVETKCGLYTGRSRIIHRLARLAAAKDPYNVKRNFKRLRKKDKNVKLEDVQARAEWLFQTFYPHVAATFHLAKELGEDPLELRGSGAGAIGLGQFLPGNYFVYGKDGDNNQRIEPYEPVDSIYSVASFLYAHGWTKSDNKRDVIKKYNNSDPYVDTVLTMAKKLKASMQQKQA